MKNKRGLSQVVTTILIIVISLVVIATFFVVLNEFFRNESSKIRTDQITTGMKIESASISLENKTATLKISREGGEGNVTGVKIIVEDDKNAISFDEEIGSMQEFEKRTVILNLSNSLIVPSKIKRISIVPILYSGASGFTFGLEHFLTREDIIKIGVIGTELNESEEETNETQGECVLDSDCGENKFLDVPYCSNDNTKVLQYEKVFKCLLGFCTEENHERIIKTCLDNEYCYDGVCIEESHTCTNETIEQDCGKDGWVGLERCASSGTPRIVQDYTTYYCISESCESSTVEKTKQECAENEICYQAECFVPLQCSQDSDCESLEGYGPAYVCEDGNCTLEEVVNNGTIASIWPFNLGEYFDSPDLEKAGIDYTGMKIIFPGSNESRCLTIIDHVLPENPEWYAYVRLNYDQTFIRPGDYYEVWERNYICTTL
jgi:hypothetical protein